MLGDVVEKECRWTRLGIGGESDRGRRRGCAAGWSRPPGSACGKGRQKLGFGMRKAVAMLALEGKQYAVATEFFDLAIAARPRRRPTCCCSGEWG